MPSMNARSLVIGRKVAEASGAGGTRDYEELENKPSINGVELTGDTNLTAEDIGAVPTSREINGQLT